MGTDEEPLQGRQEAGGEEEPEGAEQEAGPEAGQHRRAAHRAASRGCSPGSYPEPDMQKFLGGLYTGALVALGAVENPVTSEREPDLREAQYLIDTLAMLKRKTEGNLSDDEGSALQSMLHDLRMRYVQVVSSSEEEGQEEQDSEEQQKERGQQRAD